MLKIRKKLTILGRDMIEELGLEDLPEERQLKIVSEMGDALYDRILLRLVEKLNDKEAEEMNRLLKEGKEEKINEYLEKKIPNLGAIIKREVKTFQKEIIKRTKERVA